MIVTAPSRNLPQQRLLPVRPKPRDTESLCKYVIRVSERNGFNSPSFVLSRARIKGGLGVGIDVSKLATVTGWKKNLKKIEYRSKGADSIESRILGHSVRSEDLAVNAQKMCPECVLENGYVEAHFDLAVMIACPVHRRMLIHECESCGNRLEALRPGLLECSCGASLSGVRGPVAPVELVDLLDIIRRKVLSLSLDQQYSSLIPARDLGEMELKTILGSINALGRHGASSTKCTKPDFAGFAVREASRILAQWPARFLEMLSKLEPDASIDNPVYLKASRIRGLYGALRRAGAKSIAGATAEYAALHFGPGARKEITSCLGKDGMPRYVSKKRFAEMCKVDPRCVDTVLENRGILTIQIQYGKCTRTLVDLSQHGVPRKMPGRVYQLTNAAKVLDIPVSVLRRLRNEGIYKSARLPSGMIGFHEGDVAEFYQALLSRGVAGSPSEGSVLRFDRLMKMTTFPIEVKTRVISKILSRQIDVFVSTDGTLGGLLIERKKVDLWTRRAQALNCGLLTDTDEDICDPSTLPMTTQEAALTLGCHPHTVHQLAIRGMLPGKPVCRSFIFDRKVVEAFSKRYVFLTLLARNIPTTAHGLRCLARKRGFWTDSIACKSLGLNQAFIRAKDAQQLLHLATELLGWENRNNRKSLSRSGLW